MDQLYCFDLFGSPCLTQSEWASWIQAIGTLVAIAIAIWAPWSSDRKLRKLRYYSLLSLFAAMHEAMCRAVEGEKAQNNEPYFPRSQDELKHLAIALNGPALHELPDVDLIPTLLHMRTQLAKFIETAESNGRYLTIGEARFREVQKELGTIMDQVHLMYMAAYRSAPGWHLPFAYTIWKYKLRRKLQ